MNSQLFCILPIIIVIILSMITQNMFISLFIGVVSGLLIIYIRQPYLIVWQFIKILYDVLTSWNTIWVLLVCLFFGAFNKMIKESGGIKGIEKWIDHFCKRRTSTMLGTWLLGLFICISEYLSALIVGLTFQKANDQHHISRQMFSYIINSTCTTVCTIVPVSDFAVFISGLMKNANLIDGSHMMNGYLHTIPFILYSFFAILIVPLFIFKIIPLYGPMKKIEEDIIKNNDVPLVKDNNHNSQQAKVHLFFLPILTVFVLTIFTQDVLIAVLTTLCLSCVFYVIQGLFTIKECFDIVIDGMMDLFPICITIILAYMLVVVNQRLGIVELISDIILQSVPKQLLPAMIFVFLGMISFISGSFWGLAAIAFPLIGIIVRFSGINPYLCSGALISAITFGSQSCLYSDTVTLSAVSTQISNIEYFKTSAPFIMCSFLLTVLGYIILGCL